MIPSFYKLKTVTNSNKHSNFWSQSMINFAFDETITEIEIIKKIQKQASKSLFKSSIAFDYSYITNKSMQLLFKNIKVIDTPFRKIISDQKKRTKFARQEVNRIILKSLLNVNNSIFFKKKLNSFNGIQKNTSLCSEGEGEGQRRYLKKKIPSPSLIYPRGKHNKNCLGMGLLLNPKINFTFSNKMTSVTRIRNRCVLTSRSTALGKLGVSRISLRELFGFGLLPGFTKR